MYKIFFKRSAEKELRGISPPFLKKILERIESLNADAKPAGVEKLKGEDRYFRVRQGDYRIIYEMNESERKIVMIKIGHRRDVYR